MAPKAETVVLCRNCASVLTTVCFVVYLLYDQQNTLLTNTTINGSPAEPSEVQAERDALISKLVVSCFALWFNVTYNVYGRERGINSR